MSNSAQAIREYMAALRDEVRKVEAERDIAFAQVASRRMSSALREFKNPRSVERSLIADGVNPLDTNAVEAWLAENGEDYA